MEGIGGFLNKVKEGQNGPNFLWEFGQPMCGQRVPHVAREELWPCGTRGPHVATLSLAFGRATSRAPLAFFSRIRASELRIRIRFRITNRDSLTHDEDYETLKNG